MPLAKVRLKVLKDGDAGASAFRMFGVEVSSMEGEWQELPTAGCNIMQGKNTEARVVIHIPLHILEETSA